MLFLDKRVQTIGNELYRLRVRQRFPLNHWEYKEGNFILPQDAQRDPAPFRPFDGSTMYWQGPHRHYWFRCSMTVPPDMDGKPLWFHLNWGESGNPQFLLFLNGKPLQGMDGNHSSVLLSPCAHAGEEELIEVQTYTEKSDAPLLFRPELQQIDSEIEGLYWDLQVPLSAFSHLEPESKSRLDLERTLNEAVNLLDLRTPYSPAFDASVAQARAYLQKHLYEDLCGHDQVIASCIGHTHIDAAYLWPVSQTREKVCRSFATVLKLMDEYPNYRFLSSQPQLYVFLKERHPDLFRQIQQRVKEGRWEPEGGMWVEADCNLTSGESLIRQFIHGKRFFREEFGVDSRILWLPDVFGYSGALPQIMAQCGIDYFMTTKLSWNQINKVPYDTFLWRGIDGTEILTHLITTTAPGQNPQDFRTTYNGELCPDALMGGWRRYQQKAINQDILIAFGFGDGGGGPTREMLENAARMEKGIEGLPQVRQVFARQFFDELSDRVRSNPALPVWEGELYFELHRGTLTSMARNKRANRKAEIHLMDLELLSVMAAQKLPYPAAALDRLWKTALLNQFHDILPGSAIREVYEVTQQEYEALETEIAALRNQRIQALIPENEASLTVLNTKGFASDEIVFLGHGLSAKALLDGQGRSYPVQQTASGAMSFLPGLPAKGLRTYSLQKEASACACPFQLTDDRHLETPYYLLELDENGLFARLYDKENRRDVFKPGQKGNLLRMYEDKPAKYDNWDIDIYYAEKHWDVTELESLQWETGCVCATLTLAYRISNSTISQRIRFYAHSRRIDFETQVDWREHQHLLKALFPVDVHTDEATFEIQFGNLKRKTHTNTSWDTARFEACGQKWMDLSEGHYGVSLLNDCKYGHSVKDGVIGLTLIKSGIYPNPTADQEQHLFTYALYPHAEGWQQAGTVREAYRLNQPALWARGGDAGSEFSLAFVDAPNVMLETIKQAEDGRGVILRLYETENARTETVLHWNGPVSAVEECNCLEEPQGSISAHHGEIPVLIQPYQIKTFRILP